MIDPRSRAHRSTSGHAFASIPKGRGGDGNRSVRQRGAYPLSMTRAATSSVGRMQVSRCSVKYLEMIWADWTGDPMQRP